jgi:hypothetical protein
LLPLRFLKEGGQFDEPTEAAREVFRMDDRRAGIPKDCGEQVFGPPTIPNVACKFCVIPEMRFHKGQDRPDPLVGGGEGSASEGKEVEIDLSTVKVP